MVAMDPLLVIGLEDDDSSLISPSMASLRCSAPAAPPGVAWSREACRFKEEEAEEEAPGAVAPVGVITM